MDIRQDKRFNLKYGVQLAAACAALALASCAKTDKAVVRQLQFDDEAGRVRMMTFNLCYGAADNDAADWGYRRDLVIDMLAHQRADVAGLQEVTDAQFQQIHRALPAYKMIRAGCQDGAGGGQACVVLYRAERFKVADSGAFWFSNTPWKPGSAHWGNTRPRHCLWVRLREIASDRCFYVYNLQMDPVSKESRRYSVDLLSKEIGRRKYPDPVVVIGDFNMNAADPAMAVLLNHTPGVPSESMVDVWRFMHPDQAGITTLQGIGEHPRELSADHIFVDRSTAVIGAVIDARAFDGRYPSDHFPVVAVLKIRDIGD